MQITVSGVRLDVESCGTCEHGTRVLSGGRLVGHFQPSGVFHRGGHRLETSALCARGQRLYGGMIARRYRSGARLSALRRIAGWTSN